MTEEFIYSNNPTIQDRVLKTLYYINKETTYKEIMEVSGMSRFMVKGAVDHLIRRQFIKVDTKKLHWENGNIVFPHSVIKLLNPEYTFKYLSNKGTI